MTPEQIEQIRQIFREEFQKNYTSGVPRTAPHTHNGIDNLPIDPSNFVGHGGSPGGNDTDVQFNDSGTFGGDAGLTYDKVSKTLITDNISGITDSLNSLTVSTPYSTPNLLSENINIIANGGTDDFASSGNVSLTSGDLTGASSLSGNVNLTTGSVSGTSSTSGAVNISTGQSADNGSSGNINILAGENSVGDNGNGGKVVISGGFVLSGTGGKQAGWAVVTGGQTGSSSGNRYGGGVLIRAAKGHGTGADGFIGMTTATTTNGVGRANIIINAGGDASNPQFSGIFTDGQGIVFIADATTVPTAGYAIPSGGGILYSTGGALHWLGSAGTDTTIAPA